MKHAVVFLPGIVAPAAVRYPALIEELRGVRPLLHELAVYASAQPPPTYSINTELDALDRAADQRGLGRFHLFGHSGGGAVGLAYAATRGDRLVSLAVDEPATDFTAEGDVVAGWPEFDRAAELPEDEAMAAFLRLQVASDVQLPAPQASSPPWMAKRPAGIAAFTKAIRGYRIDLSTYAAFAAPVYFSRGSRTHPRWEAMQERLQGAFPDFTGEVFEGRHHLDPAHQSEPARAAHILAAFWEAAETRDGG